VILAATFWTASAEAQIITTIAGGGPNGLPALDVGIGNVSDVAADALGNIYFTTISHDRVFRIAPDGEVTVFAGAGGFVFAGDGGPAVDAILQNPMGIAVDTLGRVFVSDTENDRVRRIDLDGTITTIALVSDPRGLAVASDGSVFVASPANSQILKITPGGVVSAVAGSGWRGFDGDGGPATGASLDNPLDVALSADGTLFIADYSNNRVRMVTPAGIISTVVGNGVSGGPIGDGGPATNASLNGPTSVAVDTSGALVIADAGNQRVRSTFVGGSITTIAGNGIAGFSGDGDLATSASFRVPIAVTFSAAGNLLIVDRDNARIREVAAGTIATVAGNGTFGFSGDGGPAAGVASLLLPDGISFDALGNLYIADNGNFRVRRVTPDGLITTVAGNGTSGTSGDGGAATNAALRPTAVLADASGNLFVADELNHRVRKIAADGTISTFAGGGVGGDGGPATAALVVGPRGLAMDAAGHLLISDSGNKRIRSVALDGTISTIAGTGVAGFSGDGGPATSARLGSTYGITIDAAGNLFIADTSNHRIRKVGTDGIISTVAGTGTAGGSGDGGPATSARLNSPNGVAIDPSGNLLIADTNNNRIRKVSPDGTISTIAGTGTPAFAGDGGPAVSAWLHRPSGILTDSQGAVYFSDWFNYRVRRIGRQKPVLVWDTPADIDYGVPLGSARLNAIATHAGSPVSGTYTYDPPAGTLLNAGDGQTLSVWFTPDDISNFETVSATVSIDVLPLTPTITWLPPADIVYGTLLGATQLNATASVPGTFVYTPPSGTTLPVGATQPLSVVFMPSDSTNYTTAEAQVTITVLSSTPVARDVAITTTEGIAKSGVLPATSPAGEPLTFSIGTPPTKGTLVIDDATTGAFTYTPNADTLGYDPFTFRAADGGGESSTATGTVFVVADSPTRPGQIVRASVASNGDQANGASSFPWRSPAISADGRYVAFQSAASNLVADDTNSVADVFVHDRQTGQTTRVSVDSSGAQANQGSFAPSINADGRYVTFASGATNLVTGDTSAGVFVHDRQTGETTRVSASFFGIDAPAISGDGRYVTFLSDVSNLVAGDSNGQPDVFVHDRLSATTTRVNVASEGTEANDITYTRVSISADGRHVAFSSDASNLVAGDTNGVRDVFVHDRATGVTTRVSAADADGVSFNPSMSADGRFVAFDSEASNLVAGDTNGASDVFVHDRLSGHTTRVSIASDGTESDSVSFFPSLSADGRYVAFYSWSQLLVPGDANLWPDVFVHDVVTGTTTLVSVASDGMQGDNQSILPSISADGRFIAFPSMASNLVPDDTNGMVDVFVVGGALAEPTTPTITWLAPSDVVYGTPLGATQLNAAASVPGTFAYTPPAGTVLSIGTHTLSVEFTPEDAVRYAHASAEVNITVQPAPPLIVTATAPNGADSLYTASPYVITWNASGGAGGISQFNLSLSTDGGTTYALIPGCSGLNGAARSCTWATPGPAATKARIKVTATDAVGGSASDASNANFKIVSGTASVTVSAPNTAVNWGIGSHQTITWKHNLGLAARFRIELSRDGGATYPETMATAVAATTASAGSYVWQVSGPAAAALARLRVVAVNTPSASDVSNMNFIIAPATFTLTVPKSGTNWGYGTDQGITWSTNLGATDAIDIQLSTDGGATWAITLASNVIARSNKATLTIPALGAPTSMARLRLMWTNPPPGASATAISPANFKIEPPFVTVKAPNGGETWLVGSTQAVKWISNLGKSENVVIELSTDGGVTYPIVALATTPSDGSQSVVVQAAWVSPTAKVRLTWVKSAVLDTSNASFTVQ
jgi:sugar lactone lactonase YvrE